MRTRGRANADIALEVVGDVTEAELNDLGLERGTEVAPLQKLRDHHHALARCLATGLKPGEAAMHCGYSLSRVSILLEDPAFQDLLAVYRKEFHAGVLADVGGYMEGLLRVRAKSLRVVEEHLDTALDNDPKVIPISTALAINESLNDRSGFGKQSTNVQVSYDGLASKLAAARKAADQRRLAIESQSGTVDCPTGQVEDAGEEPR